MLGTLCKHVVRCVYDFQYFFAFIDYNAYQMLCEITFQCAVRAATKGRVLVIEGIEKAERNVLPVLNNLLENRLL